MSFAQGMAWRHQCGRYRKRFAGPVPDWICTFDMTARGDLVRLALKIGWRLPQTVLVRDEFHTGPWSLWAK